MSALVLTMSAIPVPVPAAEDPDALALARLGAGDRGAAAGIWERHGAAVWRVAVRCCPHPADAEDVMQEVALDLLRRPPAAIRGGGLRAWLCLAAANRARKRLRDEGRRGRRQVPLADRPAPVPAEPPALAERALAALGALPPAYRDPVRLRCVERLEFPVVAAACGIGERTARTRVSRGLARLRAALGVSGTGLAGIALLLPVRPAPAMPAELTGRLGGLQVVLPAGTAAGTGLVVAILGAVVVAGGMAVVIADGGGAVHGAGADAVPASATMAALRAWRDPAAALQMEIDLDRLRNPALAIPPLSALRDDRTLDLQRWLIGREQSLLDTVGVSFRPMVHALTAAARSGGGALVWKHDRSIGPRPPFPVIVIDVGDAEIPAPLLGQRIGRSQVRTAYGTADRRLVVQDGPRWIFGVESVLVGLAGQAPSPVVESAPAWVRFDASTLVATYARLAPPDLDPAGVSEVLGPGWRSARPVLTATAAIDAQGWIGAASLTGVGPCQPLRAAEVLPRYLRQVLGPFRPMADTSRLAIDADDLIRLDVGVRLDSQAATEFASEVGFDPALLSGDLSLRIRPGVPFPAITAAVGVHRDGATVAAGFARLMGLQQRSATGGGPRSAGILTGASPIGEIAIRWNEDSVAISSGTTAAPSFGPAWSEGDAVLRIDGPRAATALMPLLALVNATTGPDLVEAVWLVRPAIRHLPVWELSLSTTTDGFVASERGAPLLAPGLAVLCDVINDCSNPPAETENGMLSAKVSAFLHDPARADMVRRLRCPPHAARGALTLPERLRQCGVASSELAAILGLSADTPSELMGFPVQAHPLTLVDPRQPREVSTHSVSSGRPVDGLEIPLGNGLSLFLLETINNGKDIHFGAATANPDQGRNSPGSATMPASQVDHGSF